MEIIVLSRVKFANLFKASRKKKVDLGAFRYISINSLDLKTPVPESFRAESLVLYFEDCKVGEKVGAFTKNHAERIKDFADEAIKAGKGIIVHCTHGVSRSGAVGTALNEYVNIHCQPNKEDFDAFNKTAYKRSPHPQILEKLKEELGIL